MKRVLILIAPILMLGACAGEPAKNAAADEQRCVRDTGSRIPSSEACRNVPGRSYSRDELDRTGETTLDRQLETVDPTIRRR